MRHPALPAALIISLVIGCPEAIRTSYAVDSARVDIDIILDGNDIGVNGGHIVFNETKNGDRLFYSTHTGALVTLAAFHPAQHGSGHPPPAAIALTKAGLYADLQENSITLLYYNGNKTSRPEQCREKAPAYVLSLKHDGETVTSLNGADWGVIQARDGHYYCGRSLSYYDGATGDWDGIWSGHYDVTPPGKGSRLKIN